MQDIIKQLQRLQHTSRWLLIAQRTALVLGVAAVIALLFGLIDFARPIARIPRLVIWCIGLTAIGWVLATYVRSAVRFRPSMTDMALRVERMMPRIAGRLASSIEFAVTGADRSNPLAARVMRETERRLQGESMSRLLYLTRTINSLAVLLGIAAIIVTLFITMPGSARIGAARVLTPWSDAAWPARTGVESLMHDVVPGANVYERGKALLLRAAVTRGENDQRVDAMVRYEVDGSFQRWQQLVLTHQTDGRHERLIDTDATAVEVYFRTADSRTDAERIELVPAPAVERATLTVVPPDYAQPVMETISEELGPGVDDRSIASVASFVGSQATLSLQLNKTLPVPGGSRPSSDWIRATFDWSMQELPEFTIDEDDPSRWRLTWRVSETAQLDLDLVDQYGLSNSEPITYRIAAREDRQPVVAMTEPASDQVVLPTAVVPLEANAEDDVALTDISLRAQLRRAITDQSAESTTEPQDDVDIWTRAMETSEPAATIAETLDLADYELNEGDVVLVTAFARDSFELDGQRHAPAESAVRRLQVISELDYAEQVRRQLGGIRQNAIRIESLQGELQDDVVDEGVQPGVSRAQAQIGQRIAEQREMIQRLAEDISRNRLDDEQLQSLLEQSGDLLDYAGRASNQAAQQIEQRQPQAGSDQPTADPSARSDRPSGDAGPEPPGDARQDGRDQPGDEPRQASREDREIVDAQQQVRDELADLIELLDRDEDTWVITRRLENLLQEQQALAEATQSLGEQTVGRATDELTQAERSELERIVDRQQELSDAAQELIEEARQRADAMEDIDEQSAQAMRNAARTAEQRELDRDMQRAAQQAQQNQLNSAAAAQQSASQTMQQMLDEIEQTKRAQAEQLLRQLASLVESIERLITVQENELIALARAVELGEYSGRDRAMIRLSQNTIAVEGEARAAGQQARRIARALDRASDAQGEAIAGLRADPIDRALVEDAEQRSLELLREAKTLAEELEQQVQEDETRRQRENLIEQYRALSEMQLGIRDDTLPLTQIEQLDRRQLVESRRLGNAQDQLRVALLDMQAATDELREAAVFAHVHELLNGWSERISQSLWDGEATSDVTNRQLRIAESIGLLIDALNESMTPPDEFAENQPGEQGSGSGSPGQAPLIPPVAQLKLIRGIQEQIYNQTKDIESSSDLETALRRDRMRELGRMQRELLDLGEQLIEEMTRQRPPSPGEVEQPTE